MIVAPPAYPFAAPSAAPTAVEAVRAGEPARLDALGASLSLEPLLAAQGMSYAWNPTYLLQLGVQSVDGQYDSKQASSFDADLLYSLDLVLYNWRAEMGVGLECGLWKSSYDAKVDSTTTEKVDTWRALVGVRFADRGPDNPIWIPYFRAGVLYRTDDGNQVNDSDLGWYAGGGVDFRFGSNFAVTPQILYAESPSLNSQEWLFGLTASIAF